MIPLFKVFMAPTAGAAAAKVLDSGFIGQGEKVEEFEAMLSDWLGTDLINTTNSCTSALHLAFHMTRGSMGLTDQSEVLASPLTCTASNWPILANSLKIKWVDIDPNTMNMDLDDLERKITKNTKVILIVHWGGYPVDLDRIKHIQDKTESVFGFRPTVIEDCAHSFGSTYKEKKLGNHGNLACYSFQAIKHLTTIDGGILISPDEETHHRAKLLRWYGIDRNTNKKDFRCEADVPEWGFKFHMNDVAAAVGIENLKIVDKEVISKNQSNAKYYNKELRDLPGVTLLESNTDRVAAYWIYSLLVDKKAAFMDYMKEKKIVVSQVHERNDGHTCVKEFRSHLPNLDRYLKKLICIPNGWWVTYDDRKYIADSIRRFT